MKRPRINITQKFILYLVIISVLPLLIIGVNSYSVSDTILQEEAARYSSAVAADQRDYLELQLEQIGSLIANISGVEEITNALGDDAAADDAYTNLATQARIGYILNGYSNLRGLVSIDIFSESGTQYHVGDTLDVSNIRRDILDEIRAKTVASDQIILWSGVEENVNANSAYEKVLTVAKMMTEVNPSTLQSEPIALFLVNVRIEDIYDHFNQIDLGEDAYMIVIDTEDRIIYHPDWDRIGTSLDVINEDISGLLTGEAGEFVTTIRGKEVFVSYARSSLSDWVTLSLIPVETLTAKTAVIRNNTIITLMISFLVMGIFSWLYHRDVVLSIREITYRFQQLEEGSLDWETRMTARGNDEIGELVQWFNAFMDTLAARREAEAQIEASLHEKEAMLQEIHHRVKNNLQVISSLLNLQARRSDDPKLTAVFRDSQNRIRSMSLIHEKLYQSQNLARVDLGEYVQILTTYLMRSYRTDRGLIETEIETDEVYIDVNTAVPCGLLLNELISNALKHAFPNGRSGKLTISLLANDQQATLIVRDNGVGISDEQLANNNNTLGLQLINTLVKQIGANMDIKVEEGTTFNIKFDLSVDSN